MFNQAKWALYRIVFVITATFGALTGGLGAYLLAPLYSYYFFNDLNFLKYHQYFCPLAKSYWRFIFRLFSSEDYREEYSLGLTLPPCTSPDPAYVQLAATWDADLFDCDQCTRCCTIIDCPLMDNINHLCRAYNSFFWRYFPCGRYPKTQQQIEYYGCPKWEVRGSVKNHLTQLSASNPTNPRCVSKAPGRRKSSRPKSI